MTEDTGSIFTIKWDDPTLNGGDIEGVQEQLSKMIPAIIDGVLRGLGVSGKEKEKISQSIASSIVHPNTPTGPIPAGVDPFNLRALISAGAQKNNFPKSIQLNIPKIADTIEDSHIGDAVKGLNSLQKVASMTAGAITHRDVNKEKEQLSEAKRTREKEAVPAVKAISSLFGNDNAIMKL